MKITSCINEVFVVSYGEMYDCIRLSNVLWRNYEEISGINQRRAS